MTAQIRETTLRAGEISFGALEAGERGRLLLCLHGFPDNAWTFRYQLETFSNLGYHVVAPFQRGYFPTSPAPNGVYQSAALAQDVIALIDALAYERAAIIGHDWGALAGYGAAILAPERLSRLVAIAVPHGPAVLEAFLSDYDQLRRSWYMFFFLTPFADAAVKHDDFRFLERLWRDWSPTWNVPAEAIECVKQTFRHPGVLEAALSYYRCTLDPGRQDPQLSAIQATLTMSPVAVPTLAIHGKEDGCIGSYLLEGMEALFPRGLEKFVVEGAGHFVHQEKPDLVNERIARFLSGT